MSDTSDTEMPFSPDTPNTSYTTDSDSNDDDMSDTSPSDSNISHHRSMAEEVVKSEIRELAATLGHSVEPTGTFAELQVQFNALIDEMKMSTEAMQNECEEVRELRAEIEEYIRLEWNEYARKRQALIEQVMLILKDDAATPEIIEEAEEVLHGLLAGKASGV